MFKYSLDNKRYHTLNYYYKNKYNTKVVKIPINISCSCPNKKNGGCIYCNGDFEFSKTTESLLEQFNKNKVVFDKKWPKSKYIIYFQNGTNTYGDFNKISSIFNEALTIPNVVGITIATRPDAIDDKWLNYFKSINNKTDLTIELGLQSANDETLKLINRGHTLQDFSNTFNLLKDNNIKVVVHIINGLPNETKEMMIDTIKYLNELNIDGIKIHMLYITKNTLIEKWFNEGRIKLLSKEEYIDIVATELSYLKPEIVIHRITGDPEADNLIEPKWLIKKRQLINDIDKYMVKNSLYQGCKYN